MKDVPVHTAFDDVRRRRVGVHDGGDEEVARQQQAQPIGPAVVRSFGAV